MRQALRTLLEQELGVCVAAETENGLETIAAVKRHRPVLLMLDVAMPLAFGVEVLGEARRWSPDTRIVAFTGLTSHALWRNLAAAGADGVFLKSGNLGELREGVQTILAGGRAHSAVVAAAIADDSEADELTVRQRQILSAIARGQTNAEIARAFGIAVKTVDNHRTHIMGKLDVHSVAGLIAYALREGLLDPSQHV
jgi:DNA-binding NarL/FixJ family response regulator